MKSKMFPMILVISLILINTLVVLAEQDSDLDGIPDSDDILPFDYDNDGLPDEWEKKYNLRYDAFNANDDVDKDGIINIDEYRKGTSPTAYDEPVAIVKEVKVEAYPGGKEFVIQLTIIFAIALVVYMIIRMILNATTKKEVKIQTTQRIYVPMQQPVTQYRRMPYKYVAKPKIKKAPLQESRQSPQIKIEEKKQDEERYIELPTKKQKNENVFSRLSGIISSKEDNVFDKLKSHIDDYKVSKEKPIKRIKK